MAFQDAGLNRARSIALVGAGGKSSLAWAMIQRATQAGQRALFTTTTHVLQPAPGAFDLELIEPHIDAALARLQMAAWRSAWLASAEEGRFDGERLSWMPTLPVKLVGHAPEALTPLRGLDAILVIEADGALRRWIKAPAEHEPVIPPFTDAVVVVACLDAIGRPLNDTVAHRPERVATLTRTPVDAPITAETVRRLLLSPDGGRKGIPAGARPIAALTRVRAPRNPALERALREGGYAAVIDVDLTRRQPAR